jgi:preprotein translocase subunit SecD
MTRSWWIQFLLFIGLTVFSLMALVPTMTKIEDNSSFPIKSKINLGLDLQGGLYMVLGIDFKKVYKDEVANYIKKVQAALTDEGINSEIGVANADVADDPKHTIIISDNSQVEAAKDKIKEFFGYPLRLTNDKNNELEYGLSLTFKKEIEDSAVSKSIEVIRNRIDEFGVTEPEIISMGADRVVVQLPGVKDIERAKDLIGKTAKLEFKFVNDETPDATLMDWVDKAKKAGIEFNKGDRFSDYVAKVNEFVKNDLPNGYMLTFRKSVNKVTNETTEMYPYLVESTASLGGDDLQDAIVRIDQQNNRPYVAINFKPNGAKIFEKLTEENVGRRMAIILDGNVYSDPVIQEKIAGGNASINLGAGDYNESLTQARDLALVLRAGALPVELDFEEQRVVGPSLGGDAIKKAEYAAIVGSLLVFAFALVYYKISGVIAIVTLLLNVLFTLACLVGMEATLTLPGIAGIALTVGMAIDANIIIYERIKEEIRLGTPNREAVALGFNRAFWTILDANLTTAAAGLCLINFGTGPIRGFAVTLLIGIVATVYTAYFGSKIMFEYYIAKTSKKHISI